MKSLHCSLDLDNWRQYIGDITTNSRWISSFNDKPLFGHWLLPKRKKYPAEDIQHHGLWISEIPYQMINRFTKVDDTIWSVFAGTGIDEDVAKDLNRKCISTDLNPKRDFIIKADAINYKCDEEISMALLHPPYWDMVKYDELNESDGSSKKTLKDFLIWWDAVVDNVNSQIKDKGYIVLACGNMYRNSEEICLGEILKNMILKHGYILKQWIIKDYGETKGSVAKNYNLNYLRQLRGGYGNFYGDNIFILKKQKTKNNISALIKEFI